LPAIVPQLRRILRTALSELLLSRHLRSRALIEMYFLELHLLDVLVRGHNLVANLHHELKGNVCLLDRYHHRAQVGIVTLEQVANLLFGATTQLVYLL
jgi:hypothetical protein